MGKILGLICLLMVACRGPNDPHVDQLVMPNQERALQKLLSGADAEALKDLVVFGDSLSDIGRLHRRSFGLYIPPEVYWRGRLTNGPNWTDYVCASFKCREFNYAVAGAATRLDKIPLRWIVRPLDAQVEEFFADAPLLTTGKSIAVIWIGPNNYLHQPVMKTDQTRDEIRESAKALLKGSVEKLLIGTMPQLAGILRSPEATDNVTPESYREATAAHNRNIRDLVLELQQSFPKKQIALYDAYEINQASIDRPSEFGFKSLTEACYKGNYRGQFFGEHAFCTDYFGLKFWDYTHSNSRMHCHYASRFLLAMHEAGWLQSIDAEKALEICRQL